MPGPNQRNPLAAFMTPAAPGQALAGARLLPLDRIDPNPAQSRQVFDEVALEELAASIQAHHRPDQHGVLQAIVVRPVGDRYQIVIGERRTRAARMVGLADIPAHIRELNDEEAAFATATENLQRADLDLEDEARWFAYLQKLTGLSNRALAERLGKNRMYINRRLRLLREHPDWFALIRSGQMTQREALDTLAQEGSPGAVAHGVPVVTEDSRADEVAHGVPVATDDSSEGVVQPDPPEPHLVERATLDHRTGTVHGGDLQRTPWRERPLSSFMDWVARVDVTTVPAAERLTARQQISAAREWLGRLELQLEELGGTELG